MSIWYGKIEASEKLGISEATLWNLKNSGKLQAGKHWLFATGKKASNVLFNVDEIRNWQIEQTKITEEAPLTAAEGIATYQQMEG
tara:strand:- start:172 stop:426 length:255 start_codon:yes stop_codon:yes gene_type:complete